MKREGWFWGGLLALSLAAGLVAFVQWVQSGDADDAPPALRLDEMRPEELPGEGAARRMPPLDAPDLPAVPTLPPGTHVGARDPEAPEDDLAVEMRLVHEARRMLDTDAAAALALLEQHRTRFPRGALREEREAYAIEAMIALEHTEAVERRYLEFREDFPESAFLSRLAERMR